MSIARPSAKLCQQCRPDVQLAKHECWAGFAIQAGSHQSGSQLCPATDWAERRRMGAGSERRHWLGVPVIVKQTQHDITHNSQVHTAPLILCKIASSSLLVAWRLISSIQRTQGRGLSFPPFFASFLAVLGWYLRKPINDIGLNAQHIPSDIDRSSSCLAFQFSPCLEGRLVHPASSHLVGLDLHRHHTDRRLG